MNTKELNERIETIRDLLTRADNAPADRMSIGLMLVALGNIVDLIEATNKRVDHAFVYAGSVSQDY